MLIEIVFRGLVSSNASLFNPIGGKAMKDDTINDSLLRVWDIIGRPASNDRPAIKPLIPVSKSTWWKGVRDGRFPKPIKLGDRVTAWKASDIQRLID